MSRRLGYRLIPPARWDALTPLFDAFSMEKAVVRRDLLRLIGTCEPQLILEVGSGTGAQTALTASYFPEAQVYGVEPDVRSMGIAVEKNRKRNCGISFVHGIGEEIPFKDGTFDMVVSTAMLHHLPSEGKKNCMKDVFRVLKPDGLFGIMEVGKPRTLFGKIVTIPLKYNLWEYQRDCLEGMLPVFLEESGFVDIEEHRKFSYLGPSIFISRKPS